MKNDIKHTGPSHGVTFESTLGDKLVFSEQTIYTPYIYS